MERTIFSTELLNLAACILRASAVDSEGNISTKYDPMTAEQLEMGISRES